MTGWSSSNSYQIAIGIADSPCHPYVYRELLEPASINRVLLSDSFARQLAEAISIEPGQKFLNLDTVVNERERLVKVCISLVRKDPDTDEIFLAVNPMQIRKR